MNNLIWRKHWLLHFNNLTFVSLKMVLHLKITTIFIKAAEKKTVGPRNTLIFSHSFRMCSYCPNLGPKGFLDRFINQVHPARPPNLQVGRFKVGPPWNRHQPRWRLFLVGWGSERNTRTVRSKLKSDESGLVTDECTVVLDIPGGCLGFLSVNSITWFNGVLWDLYGSTPWKPSKSIQEQKT